MNAVRDLAIEEIAKTWSLSAFGDSELSPCENGFDWLPGSHTVHVRIFDDERKSESPLPGRFRITIFTDFLRSVPVLSDKFTHLVGASSKFLSSGYSFVYPPFDVWKEYFNGQPAEMQLFSSAYVDQAIAGWLPSFLAQMAIMQPINAEIRSTTAFEMFGGGVPAFAGGSKKASISEILNLGETVFVPEGKKENKWSGSDEFEQFAEKHAKNDFCFGLGDKEGMTLETPFGADSAIIRFQTDQQHPQLGNGLLITTQIRSSQRFEDVCVEAASLNYFESRFWTDFPQLGCWHPQEASENVANWAHTCFIPNALFRSGLVANFAFWAMARVQWVRHTRFPQLKDQTMAEILESRFRH